MIGVCVHNVLNSDRVLGFAGNEEKIMYDPRKFCVSAWYVKQWALDRYLIIWSSRHYEILDGGHRT